MLIGIQLTGCRPIGGVSAVPGTGRASQSADRRSYHRGMADRTQIREFLTTRRARITPEQAGLPVYGGSRRVAGLRREEVALLAGVSVDYYNKLERRGPAIPGQLG